jgi:hypothetical protein
VDDLIRGIRALGDAHEDYRRAEQYYEGDPEEFFANVKLRRLLADMGERYKINMAKKVVDVPAKRLRVNSFSVPDDDAATAAIEEIADANDLDLHGPNFARRALEYGDAYAVVWPFYPDQEGPDGAGIGTGSPLPNDPAGTALRPAGTGGLYDGEDVVIDDAQAREMVEITYNSPLSMRMIYDDEHPNRKAYAIKRWEVDTFDPEGAPTKSWRANLYYPDRIERYVTKVGTKGKHREEWEAYGEPIDNPFGEIPVFHFRTDAPYGRPEHYDAYGPQDAINKLFVTQMATIDSQGFPQRYGLADPESVLDANTDDADWEDDGAAVTGETDRADQRSGLRGGPATMLMLQGLREVGQFPAAEPSVFIDPFALYVRAMGSATDTPVHYFDPTGGQKPSGESLRAEDAPMEDKVDDRRTWLGSTWQELWLFVLKIRGVQAKAVEVNWKPASVLADGDAWAVIATKQQNGVPQRQTLLEAGYSADQVDEWLDADQAELDLLRRVQVIDTLGDAVQKLGTGIGFGILTAESAAQVLQKVLGELSPGVDITGDPAELEAQKQAEQKQMMDAMAKQPGAPGPGGAGKPPAIAGPPPRRP